VAAHRRSPVHRLAGQIRYRAAGRPYNPEVWFQGTAELAREVGRSLREAPPDLVHAAYWFSLRRLAARPRPPVWVVDTHDVQFERWEKLRGSVPSREREAEIAELSRYDVVVAITPQDARTLRGALEGSPRIETIGMGVDLDHWNRHHPSIPPRRRGAVLYYGNLAGDANREAATHLCREILPVLRRLRPDAEVLLVGANPGADVRALATIPGVSLTGTLEDVRPALAGGGVFALAFRAASGIRSRALEVMALEIPVVAYPEALTGMNLEPGRDYLPARTPEEFARQLDSVLSDPGLASRLGAAGRAQVAACYGKDRTYGKFVDLYAELIGREGRS
jgi:glycosyltransferase involved in cell wall biosynthesis